MQKGKLCVAILLWAAAIASAQTTTAIILDNQEDSTFYFVIDPPDLGSVTSSSPLLASKLTTYFATETDAFPFTAVKAHASLTMEGLSQGTHLVVGFFAIEGASDFPVRTISVLVDQKLGQRLYGLYSTPAFMEFPRGTGKLAQFGSGSAGESTVASAGAQTQNPAASAAPEQAAAQPATPQPAAAQPPQPAAAAAAQPQASAPSAPAQAAPSAPSTPAVAAAPAAAPTTLSDFSAFSPTTFTRESQGAFSVHPIADSQYWNRNGTRLSSISASRVDGSLTVALSSASGFSSNVSYYFYLFGKRPTGTDDAYTIEIKPLTSSGNPGVAVLWEKGVSQPVLLCPVSIADSTCTATASLSSVPADAVASLGADPTADVTASYFDRSSGTYEEFFYTTLALSQVPQATR